MKLVFNNNTINWSDRCLDDHKTKCFNGLLFKPRLNDEKSVIILLPIKTIQKLIVHKLTRDKQFRLTFYEKLRCTLNRFIFNYIFFYELSHLRLKIVTGEFGGLKTLNTFGNCQRPVFPLGGSQQMHRITNLWKLGPIGHWSCKNSVKIVYFQLGIKRLLARSLLLI